MEYIGLLAGYGLLVGLVTCLTWRRRLREFRPAPRAPFGVSQRLLDVLSASFYSSAFCLVLTDAFLRVIRPDPTLLVVGSLALSLALRHAATRRGDWLPVATDRVPDELPVIRYQSRDFVTPAVLGLLVIVAVVIGLIPSRSSLRLVSGPHGPAGFMALMLWMAMFLITSIVWRAEMAGDELRGCTLLRLRRFRLPTAAFGARLMTFSASEAFSVRAGETSPLWFPAHADGYLELREALRPAGPAEGVAGAPPWYTRPVGSVLRLAMLGGIRGPYGLQGAVIAGAIGIPLAVAAGALGSSIASWHGVGGVARIAIGAASLVVSYIVILNIGNLVGRGVSLLISRGDVSGVFRTERHGGSLLLAFVGAFTAGWGALMMAQSLRHRTGLTPAAGYGMQSVALLALLGGGSLLAHRLLSFFLVSFAVTPDAIRWRNWHCRTTVIAWRDVLEVVSERRYRHGQDVSRLFIVYRTPTGRAARLKVVVQAGPEGMFADVLQTLVSQGAPKYAQRRPISGMEYDYEDVWRPRLAQTGPPPPSQDRAGES